MTDAQQGLAKPDSNPKDNNQNTNEDKNNQNNQTSDQTDDRGNGSEQLAQTGADSMVPAALAVVFTLAGGLALVAARKKNPR